MLAGARPRAQRHARTTTPGKYAVKIDSAPQGATIYIDDKTLPRSARRRGPASSTQGDYTVIIELAGLRAGDARRSRSRAAQGAGAVRPAREEGRSAEDRRQRRRRSQERRSARRSGSTVEPQGQAPVTITTTAGRHLLEIKKDGFETVLDSGSTRRRTRPRRSLPSLKEIAKPKYGTIVVDADVPDAEVYIDGNKHPDNTPARDQQRDRGPARHRGAQGARPAVEADGAGHREPADQGPRRARRRR